MTQDTKTHLSTVLDRGKIRGRLDSLRKEPGGSLTTKTHVILAATCSHSCLHHEVFRCLILQKYRTCSCNVQLVANSTNSIYEINLHVYESDSGRPHAVATKPPDNTVSEHKMVRCIMGPYTKSASSTLFRTIPLFLKKCALFCSCISHGNKHYNADFLQLKFNPKILPWSQICWPPQSASYGILALAEVMTVMILL